MEGQAQAQINELQQQLGGQQITQESMAELDAKKKSEQEQRDSFMARICTPEALDRLKRVAIVKPQIAESVQNALLGAAQAGQLGAAVSEAQVMEMLEKTGAQKAAQVKVTFQRKTYFDESDDDNDDDLL